MKCEATFSGPYAHKGLIEPDERVVEVVAAVRDAVGPDMDHHGRRPVRLRLGRAGAAARTPLAELDVFFLETPLWVDDLDGYAELQRRTRVRIAQGEWLSTRHEFSALMDTGSRSSSPTSDASAGLPRRGGCATWPPTAGRLVVPHAWKTGISVAAAAHLAMVTPHMPFFEFLPAELCESRLRKELTRDELVFATACLAPRPTRPRAPRSARSSSSEFAGAAGERLASLSPRAVSFITSGDALARDATGRAVTDATTLPFGPRR